MWGSRKGPARIGRRAVKTIQGCQRIPGSENFFRTESSGGLDVF
jgi:hypothetical protein